MKTFIPDANSIDKKWYIVDAKDKVLGRLATRIAIVLRGKNKPTFTPHMDTGDNIIVINADKVALTGDKLNQKTYYWHTGFPGGIKSIKAKDMLIKKPEKLVQLAVKGMLPKNKLGRAIMKNLKIYTSKESHPHAAQKPVAIEL